MIECNEDYHSEHDYCRLIETEKPVTGIQRNIEIRKYDIPGLNILISDFNNIGFTLLPQKLVFYSKSKTPNIYILNNSFLI
jgi:hypothetical protein